MFPTKAPALPLSRINEPFVCTTMLPDESDERDSIVTDPVCDSDLPEEIDTLPPETGPSPLLIEIPPLVPISEDPVLNAIEPFFALEILLLPTLSPT